MSNNAQNPYGCGDNSCVFVIPGRPTGMRTNVGCRCLKLKTSPNDRVKLRRAIRWTIGQIPQE